MNGEDRPRIKPLDGDPRIDPFTVLWRAIDRENTVKSGDGMRRSCNTVLIGFN